MDEELTHDVHSSEQDDQSICKNLITIDTNDNGKSNNSVVFGYILDIFKLTHDSIS